MQFGGLGELIDTVECRVGFGELCFVEQTNADPRQRPGRDARARHEPTGERAVENLRAAARRRVTLEDRDADAVF